MSGGQEKNFSILGPKLSDSKAQQCYGDKQRQIRIEIIDYKYLLFSGSRKNSGISKHISVPL